jgi:hypothetical protein
VTHRQRECPLCFSQLATGATVFAQRIRRWFGEGHAIGFVAQLLEISNERLEPPRVTAMSGQHATRIRVERSGIFAGLLRRALARDRPTLLSPRHSVPAPAARTTAVAAATIAAALLEAI